MEKGEEKYRCIDLLDTAGQLDRKELITKYRE